MPVEHRHYPRIQMSVEVDLIQKGQHIGNAVTKDLSLGGVSLLLDNSPLNPNDIILLRVWIQGEVQTLQGYVIYTSQNLSGVMLIGMSKEATRAYFNFLRKLDIPLREALNKTQ
jgi:hypothetical protein